MAATPLTLMDGSIASTTVTADATLATAVALDSSSSNQSGVATQPAVRPTMLFGSTERLDTSAAVTNVLISPNGSCSGSGNSAATSPSFLPEMPQWKKDLIQRRKSNVARTIGAATAAAVMSPISAAAQQQRSGGQQHSPTTTNTTTTTAADGFSPTTITPSRDLTAVASKSGIQVATVTTTTKVSKLTASQYQYQEELEKLHCIQQKHATVITAAEQQQQMSLIMKRPTATAPASPTAPAAAIGAATIVSPTPCAAKRNSPTSSNNSTPTKEKSERILVGGHYTPQQQQNRERRESGGDRQDWDTTHREFVSPTKTIVTGAAVPIPKQRSAYSPIKNASSTAAKETIAGEKSGTTTRLTGKTVTAAAAEVVSEKRQSTAGGGEVTIEGNNTTTTDTAGSGHGGGDGDGDGEECTENETTALKAAVSAESGGTYAVTSRQIPSTIQAGSPTRAKMSAVAVAASTPLSPTLVAAQATQSQLSQQFHSKNERERTYTEQRGASSSAGNNSSYISTAKKVQTQENTAATAISSNTPYSATSSTYSPSNYVTPPLTSSTSSSGKIFSKLHNNQFIKNQQLQQAGAQTSAATQSNITARYLKYKSSSYTSHAPESAGGSETGSGYTGLPGTYSPTKSFVAPTASAIKKKMVAVQEMKTTQPSGNHPHRAHHNHHQQQHIQQMIGTGGAGGVGGGGTCARPMALTGGRARPPSQSEEVEVNFDPGEDLSYGPGIVSKLRCRYLSLAFRESMEKERHCLDNMRRATSLNNLLDRDDPADEDDEPEDDLDGGEAIDLEVREEDEYVELRADADKTMAAERKLKTQGGILKHNNDAAAGAQENTKKTTTFQKHAAGTFAANGSRLPHSAPAGGAGIATNATNVGTPDTPRSRHVKRGNDSLKRARSVEALLCERTPWQYAALNRSSYQPQRFAATGNANYALSQPTCVTIEDKINNGRSRLLLGTDVMPPKRLTSVIDDTERPPPDLVKQTLKKFEATANRRGRGPSRTNGTGEVASKVATYKTIIKENKPAIMFPKPPISPTKKLNAPVLTKPAAKPVVGAADLLNSPLGRKTTAVAGVNTAAGKTSPATSNAAAVTGVLSASSSNSSAVGVGGLSEHSPDIIPKHKLLTEKSELLAHGVVDSPVTALTKKLEKLRIETSVDKPKQAITTKETKQPTQLNKQQQAHSALEPTNSDNEFVNNSELNNDDNNTSNSYSNKLVGGGAVGEGEAAGDSDAALEGNENSNSNYNKAKQHNDRAGTSAASSIGIGSVSGVDESVVEPDSVLAGTAAISSDLSDDDDGLVDRSIAAAAAPTKRITRTALDNIARAGTTQQFKFAGSSGQTQQKTQTKQQQLNSSNLNPDIPSSVLNAAPGKQIGVIRPLPTTTAAQQAANTASATNSPSISNQQQLLQQHMEALKQHNVYSSNSTSTTTTATHSSIYHHSTPSPPQSQQQQLTSREIEKNRINEMKKTGALADGGGPTAGGVMVSAGASANANSHAVAAANASLNTVINTNAPGHKSNAGIGAGAAAGAASSASSTSGFNELDAAAPGANNSPLWALRIKRQTPSVAAQENTSMVFNFSNRKEVPDYIENDGVIFRRKRELPKPNESGFVLLGDLSLETSTDSDYDDFSMCPPSPCDVEFENANIVIDGKSSIRQKSKEATFRVQFNDTLTSTFEYPSEASLIIDDSFSNDALISAYENFSLNDSTDSSPTRHHHVAVDEIIQLPTPASPSPPANNASSATNTPTKNILGNLPLGSAPLGFYTPVKAPIDNLFQLGVTRAPNGNGHHAYNKTSTPTTNGTTATQNGQSNGGGGSGNSNGSNNGGGNSEGGADEGEETAESLQYIKPANDDLTIAYSEGTQKTDLLY
ncbi:uncharacterized protein LOC118748764 isoform X2 [Rhagoletis pomonella]|uniref:uncharacterized protein LOC118748764 isoform X2 n=1 Tax=Rhagoletis pomonella TaxID=28610 RepID=UPI00177B97F5|nr:uncharacterized protein LOC118748764 isoform X2 [Rhagoletis pomonella]